MDDLNSALINFLNPKLAPKVICNAASADHYEADNLLSNDSSIKSRGFIAYSTIKPPIELEFQLLCNVNIHYIKLITTVGSQKCTGIEILAKYGDKAPYVTLAKINYDKPGVIVCDRKKYKPDHSLFNQNLHTCYFNRHTFQTFLKATSVKVIIFRTEKSVPCIGSVEIWGTPSATCSRTTVETINKLMQNSSNVGLGPVERTKSSASKSSDNAFQIPQDFKDDLTFELMTIPMTLPSGKTVDQSTLDKHLEVEKSFGRRPCDPFTGKKFTDTCKPILNVGLKSRIDMFLIQNSHRKETFNLKRIVGRFYNNGAGSSACGDGPVGSKRGCDKELNESDRRGQDSLQLFKRRKLANECCVCKNCDNLYIISCNHLYCRNCILECCKKLECSQCQVKFERTNVRKYHL